MSKKCKGCGVTLQNTDPKGLGYTPKMEADYCQRCFRMSHYGDVTISMQQGIEAAKTLEQINALDGVVFWIVDLFNLEEGLISRLNQKLPGKKIVMIATKRDILPPSFTDDKLYAYLQERLQEEGIEVEDIIITGHMQDGFAEGQEDVEKIKGAMDYWRDGKDVIFMGVANAGKSTLINRLAGSSQLTTSRNPGTTLDVVSIDQNGFTLFDTPGIENRHSILAWLPAKDLKLAAPYAAVRPRVFQIRENQSFAVGGLVRLDVWCKGHASVVGYFSRDLEIHRGKLNNAPALWQNHYGDLLSPTLGALQDMKTLQGPKMKKDEKLDVYIYGLGWFCLSGDITGIQVQVPANVYVSFRKAMI